MAKSATTVATSQVKIGAVTEAIGSMNALLMAVMTSVAMAPPHCASISTGVETEALGKKIAPK